MSVEEPAFRVQLRDGPFEVRDYPSLVVAEVVVSGDQRHAANQGFRMLASYIFGGNARREKIAMTAPVTLLPTDRRPGSPIPWVEAHWAGQWVMRFTMPKAYVIDALPPPKDARVRLRAAQPTRVAVVRFSGLANSEAFGVKAQELNAWMKRRALPAMGSAALAQYDPPWTRCDGERRWGVSARRLDGDGPAGDAAATRHDPQGAWSISQRLRGPPGGSATPLPVGAVRG